MRPASSALFPGALCISVALHGLALFPFKKKTGTTTDFAQPQLAGQVRLRLVARASAAATGASGRMDSDVVSRHNNLLQNSVVYPQLARQYGWSGTAELTVLVGPDSRAADIIVKKSSGYEILDRAATRAIQQHQFGGMTGSATFTFIFRLRDD
jgi:TonB family protein